MRIYKVVEETIEKEVDVDILCNQCGGSCKTEDVDSGNIFGLVEAKVRGGYGAKLGDMTSYIFSICENCLPKLFESFKIQPEIRRAFDDPGPKFSMGSALLAEVIVGLEYRLDLAAMALMMTQYRVMFDKLFGIVVWINNRKKKPPTKNEY